VSNLTGRQGLGQKTGKSGPKPRKPISRQSAKTKQRKAELKRKGVTYAQLVEKLASMGIIEKEVNIANKLSRGKFSATFMLQCLTAIGAKELRLD